MWSVSSENSIIEEPIPASFLQQGKEMLFQAQQMKSSNIRKSIRLYRDASKYFTQAVQNITDFTTKSSLVYLANSAKRNADLLEKSMNLPPLDHDPAAELKYEESIAGRPALDGSRGRVIGVSKVPRSIPSSDDDITKDLQQLESKLARIGVMPPSVMMAEKSSQVFNSSINFCTSKLEDSFLYLSAPPTTQVRKAATTSERLRLKESHHPTFLPSTISQKYPSPARNRSHGSPSSVKPGERQPVSGPYGGKKKTPDKTPASWGTAAGGFLTWATTGINTYQQPQQQAQQQQQSQQPQQHPQLSHPPSQKSENHVVDNSSSLLSAQKSTDLSVNWNDRSTILPTDDSNFPMDQSYVTSAGALQLLNTVKKLKAEKERLETMVDSLQAERGKDEMLKQQVEDFKKEYKEKIGLIKKKIVSMKASQSMKSDEIPALSDSPRVLATTHSPPSETTLSLEMAEKNETPINDEVKINPETFFQLEKLVQRLAEKVHKLKEENRNKDLIIKSLENSRHIPNTTQQNDSSRRDLSSIDNSLQSPKSPNSISKPLTHPNISAQHLTSLSQRRGASASSSTATLATSLKRDFSGNGGGGGTGNGGGSLGGQTSSQQSRKGANQTSNR